MRPLLFLPLGVLAAVAVLVPASTSTAEARSSAPVATLAPAASLGAPPLAARGARGRGAGSRSRGTGSRRSPYRSRGTLRRTFGGILKVLGIAYLVNALFGWGPGGGSPFGLLIVLAFIAWLVVRRRRRQQHYGRPAWR